MEDYRDKLKLDIIINGIGCLVLAAFCFFMAACESGLIPFVPATGDSHWASMWRGFSVGAACGILGMMLLGLAKIVRALKDEKELKKLYVKEHDERQIQIWTAARAASMQVFLILGMVAGIVAGYFNMVVSITIIVCITVQAWLGLGFKLYYSRKY